MTTMIDKKLARLRMHRKTPAAIGDCSKPISRSLSASSSKGEVLPIEHFNFSD